jgi:heme-degrading monooxygenase HmoA
LTFQIAQPDNLCSGFFAAACPSRQLTVLSHCTLLLGVESVILEVAILEVKPGLATEFETAFKTASAIIGSMPGYLSHELQRCIETQNRYLLLVRWQTLEDPTVGFRQSPEYQEWRALLHHFYDPFPVVEHYETA